MNVCLLIAAAATPGWFLTPEQWFASAAVAGGLLWGIWEASRKGAQKGSEVVQQMTASQNELLHKIAASQLATIEGVESIKTSTSTLATKVGEVVGEQRALSDGQRALADTVHGLALAHVQLEAIVHRREPDTERLNALTAKLTPAPPAERRKG